MTNKRSVVPTTVSVWDITGREDYFKLDTHGFQLCRHEVTSRCRNGGYASDEIIKTEYYPEMEQLLKNV